MRRSSPLKTGVSKEGFGRQKGSVAGAWKGEILWPLFSPHLRVALRAIVSFGTVGTNRPSHLPATFSRSGSTSDLPEIQPIGLAELRQP